MRKRGNYGTYFVCVCVCVSVCVESTAQEQILYNKLSIAADFLIRFRDFQLTELSEVVSFTSNRPFRSLFEAAAIFLHDELPRTMYSVRARASLIRSIWSAP